MIDLHLAGADNQMMVVVDNSERARLHRVDDMGCVGFFLGHTDMVLCADTGVTAGGAALLATGSKDKALRVWDVASQVRSCIETPLEPP